GELAGPGREADSAHLAFAAALIFVTIGAEADDARAPHRGRLPGGALHQRAQGPRVRAALRIGDGIEKVVDGCGRRLGLVLRHPLPPASVSTAFSESPGAAARLENANGGDRSSSSRANRRSPRSSRR